MRTFSRRNVGPD